VLAAEDQRFVRVARLDSRYQFAQHGPRTRKHDAHSDHVGGGVDALDDLVKVQPA
jgi:hypothetical protein